MRVTHLLPLSVALLVGTGGLLSKGAQAAPQQTPVTLAPPVDRQGEDLFDWRDTPRDERISIVRATFDQRGYQLIDSNGQVIFIPFVNGNLYVMQFGKTSDSMYFVNEGGQTPVLYVPANGFLENASVPGARWYPFPQRYYYTAPVYLGPAPSWDAYVTMGWYPSTVIYGGYGSRSAWRVGVAYNPLPGWCITVDNRPYRAWYDYDAFCRSTPVRRVVFVDRPIVRDTVYVNRPYSRGDRNDRRDDFWSKDNLRRETRDSRPYDREVSKTHSEIRDTPPYRPSDRDRSSDRDRNSGVRPDRPPFSSSDRGSYDRDRGSVKQPDRGSVRPPDRSPSQPAPSRSRESSSRDRESRSNGDRGRR